jgi:hypothetical protein
MGTTTMNTQLLNAKFKPGTLAITPACMDKVDPQYALAALVQHLQGKWGLIDREDEAVNNFALENGGRLVSVYPLPNDAGDFWIITEGDRSVTTMLLPSDY